MTDRILVINLNEMQNNEILFCPMVSWVSAAAENAGYAPEEMILSDAFDFSGAKGKQVLILPCNMPLITPEVLAESEVFHRTSDAKLTLLGGAASGAFWVDGTLLAEVGNISELFDAAENPAVFPVSDTDALLTAVTKKELLELNKIAAARILEKHMDNGVEVLSDDGVLIDPRVKISAGCIIYPGTILKGETVIGENCILGPNTVIRNSTVGNNCELNASQIEDSVLENGINMGPFAHIRPNSHIGNGVHLGNFTEVKNSNVGDRTAVSHLTYVGDSDVGVAVNFGCGCVTVNYDGQKKHRTTIGDHAFIGCNTNLVAPVTVEDFGYTAAGSTITQNVPKKALAIARARQYNKEGWAEGKIKIK